MGKNDVYFDKSKSYIDDYTAPALAANGAGLSLSLASALDFLGSGKGDLPVGPMWLFLFGLICAFVSQFCVWIINQNNKRAEMRDEMMKFYNKISSYIDISESKGGLNESEILSLKDIEVQIIDFQKKSLSPAFVSILMRFSAQTYFISVLIFLFATIWCVKFISEL